MCKELKRWVTSESDVILPCLNPLSQQWRTDQERGETKKETSLQLMSHRWEEKMRLQMPS